MIITKVAGGVVISRSGQVLIVNQNGNSWSLPKGHVDPGESLLRAAQREIGEESGISKLKLVCELGSYERYKIGKDPSNDDKTELKQITMFLFKTTQTELAPTDPHNPCARWAEPKDVSELLTHQKDRDFYNSIISKVHIN